MKQACCLMVLMVATLVLADSRVGSAESDRRWQQGQSEKKKDEGQEKAGKVSGALGAKTNPVRCENPRGERQYLSRLRCSDGKRPEFSRIGSFGEGPYGNILDGYRVKCEGSDEATIFMDMYHEGYVEREAVPGFTIVE